MLLLVQPSLLSGARCARLLPSGANDQCLAQQLLHAVECAVSVGHLAALGLRGHTQHAEAADAAGQALADEALLLLAQWQAVDVSLDRDLRLDLVHVLPAGTAAA